MAPFKIIEKILKYVGINQNKAVQYPYEESYEIKKVNRKRIFFNK